MMDGCGYPTKWAGRDYRVGEQERVQHWVRWVWPRRSRVITTSSLREGLWIGTFELTFGLMECNLFEVSRFHEDCQQSVR